MPGSWPEKNRRDLVPLRESLALCQKRGPGSTIRSRQIQVSNKRKHTQIRRWRKPTKGIEFIGAITCIWKYAGLDLNQVTSYRAK